MLDLAYRKKFQIDTRIGQREKAYRTPPDVECPCGAKLTFNRVRDDGYCEYSHAGPFSAACKNLAEDEEAWIKENPLGKQCK